MLDRFKRETVRWRSTGAAFGEYVTGVMHNNADGSSRQALLRSCSPGTLVETISIAALCTGLLCLGLCAGAYLSEHRPGNEPEPAFWDLAGCGVTALILGARGLLRHLTRRRSAPKP